MLLFFTAQIQRRLKTSSSVSDFYHDSSHAQHYIDKDWRTCDGFFHVSQQLRKEACLVVVQTKQNIRRCEMCADNVTFCGSL